MPIYVSNPAYSSSGSGSSIAVRNHAGIVFKNEDDLYADTMAVSTPLRLENADGIDDRPHLTILPVQLLACSAHGVDGTATTEVRMPVDGADEFCFDTVLVTHVSKVPDAAFRYEIWTMKGGTGCNIVRARPIDIDSTKFEAGGMEASDLFAIDPFVGRPDTLFLRITVPNTTSLSFDLFVFAKSIKAIRI